MSSDIKLAMPAKLIMELLNKSNPTITAILQDHILKAVLRKQFTCQMPKNFNEKCEKYIKEVAKEYFTMPGESYDHYRDWVLKPDIVTILKKQAYTSLQSAQWEIAYKPHQQEITDILHTTVKNLKNHVENELVRWKSQIDKFMEKRVNEKMAAYIEEAAEAKFQLLKSQMET